MILSSHHYGGLASVCFHSITAHIHMLSVKYCDLSKKVQLPFSVHHNYILHSTFEWPSLWISLWYFCIDLFMTLCIIVTSCWSSFFVVTYISLAYNIAGKMLLLKWITLWLCLSCGKCLSPWFYSSGDFCNFVWPYIHHPS